MQELDQIFILFSICFGAALCRTPSAWLLLPLQNVMTNLFSASNFLFQAIDSTLGCFEPRLRDRFAIFMQQRAKGKGHLIYYILFCRNNWIFCSWSEVRVKHRTQFPFGLFFVYIVCFSRSLCHIYMLIDIFITPYWSVCQRMGKNQRYSSENSGGWSCTGSESYRIDRSNNSSG